MDRWWKDNIRNRTKEHKMEDGRWKMEDGRWKMEVQSQGLKYEWRMEDGDRKTKGSEGHRIK